MNLEENLIDITEGLTVSFKCHPSYFFNPFISEEPIEKALKDIDEVILFYKFMLVADIDLIVSTIRKSKDDEDAQKNLMNEFDISKFIANQIVLLNFKAMTGLGGYLLEDRIKKLEFFRDYFAKYEEEFRNEFK